MPEYIEKEVPISTFKKWADACEKAGEIDDFRTMSEVLQYVSELPAADVVAVVRCKDCKWYLPDTEWGIDETTGRHDHSKIITKPYGSCHGQDFNFTEDGCLRVGDNDFCSCGERRGEDG